MAEQYKVWVNRVKISFFQFLRFFFLISKKAKQRRCLEWGGEILTIKYWKNKKDNTKVVYSCMSGNYDTLINHKYVDENYDYIYFTDNNDILKHKIIGVWQIKPLVKSFHYPILNNRWHKMMPHELFPQYEVSVYIDSNLDILSSYVFEKIDTIPSNVSMAFSPHYVRDCIYQELAACFCYKKEKMEVVEALKEKYIQEGMPKDYGLTENGIIVRRHMNAESIEIMESWWELLNTLSKRDQLSLMYIFWKKGIKPYYFISTAYANDRNNFKLYSHVLPTTKK